MKNSRFAGALLLRAVSVLLLAAVPPARAQFSDPVGGYDPTYNPSVGGFFVAAMALQPDGKMIIGGDSGIARLNVDGSVDASFTASTNEEVDCVAVQTDGKILLGGDFTTVNGTARNRIARLNANGSLESTATFNPGTGADSFVNCLAVQADGKIVVGGKFTHINGTLRGRLARLNANGSLDATFTGGVEGFAAFPVPGVYSVAVQADGKIVAGGYFIEFGGASHIKRFNADGSTDLTFNSGTGANDVVHSVAVQADGKIVLGGGFTLFNGTMMNRIARLNANGSLESGGTFSPGTGANGVVNCVAVQVDGKILLGGEFEMFNGSHLNGIARLNANGSLESTATFDPGDGGGGMPVSGVALQADGKIMVCGTFPGKLVRLVNDPVSQTVSAPDRTQVLWSRGGSAPNVGPVTFELSTNGGTVWTALGAGTRVGTTPNWQRTGLSLPPTGQLRARGRTTGGAGGGSFGLVDTVSSFTLPGIAVAQAAGIGLADGGSVPFSTVRAGSSGTPLTFTIRNSGSANLTGLAVTKNGTDSAAFTVSALSATSIPVGTGTVTFTVTFFPTTPGAKTAALHIASNLTGALNPFDINLTGLALSSTLDTDGDGMNDFSEFQMAAQGFNWQVSQPALVTGYTSSANGAGYFNAAQIQALSPGMRFLQRNPATGQFKLELSLRKATNLTNYVAFPFLAPQTTVTPGGKIEYLFTAPDNAAFYRLEAQ